MTILRWVIRPDFEARGIDRLEETTRSHKLVYDKDKAERPEHRQRVLKQLYDVARKRQMFERDEMGMSTLRKATLSTHLNVDGDNFITVSHLYREPGRKRYRHRVKNQGTVELSPPPLEASSSQEPHEDENQVMTEEPPPLGFQFDQAGQPTPISVSEEPAIGRDELFDQHSMQSFSPGRPPESPYLEQPPFRPPQTEQFSHNAMYRPDYSEHQVPQHFFGSQPVEWQQRVMRSLMSPVASQASSNSNFKPAFQDTEPTWHHPPHVALSLSALPLAAPHEMGNPSLVASSMQERSPSSYQVSDAGGPIHLGPMNPVQERYPPVAMVNGMMQSFDACTRSGEVFHQRNNFAPWPSTAPPPPPPPPPQHQQNPGWQAGYAANPPPPY